MAPQSGANQRQRIRVPGLGLQQLGNAFFSIWGVTLGATGDHPDGSSLEGSLDVIWALTSSILWTRALPSGNFPPFSISGAQAISSSIKLQWMNLVSFYVSLSLIKHPVFFQSFFFLLDLVNHSLEIHSLFGILVQQVLRKVIKRTQRPVYKRDWVCWASRCSRKLCWMDGRIGRMLVCLGVNSERLPSLQ